MQNSLKAQNLFEQVKDITRQYCEVNGIPVVIPSSEPDPQPVEPDPFDRVLYSDELLVQAISDHLLYNPEFLRMCRHMACNATNPSSMGSLIRSAVRKRVEDL